MRATYTVTGRYLSRLTLAALAAVALVVGLGSSTTPDAATASPAPVVAQATDSRDLDYVVDFDDPYNFPARTIGEGLKLQSVVLRIDTGGIYVHANGSHANFGVQEVAVESDGYLHIYGEGTAIASVQCQPDESIGAARGILTGVSGGAPHTVVRLRDTRINRMLDLTDPADYARVASTYSNLWCQWTLWDGVAS